MDWMRCISCLKKGFKNESEVMAFLCDTFTACVSFYKCVVIYRYVVVIVVICMRDIIMCILKKQFTQMFTPLMS